MEKVKRTTKQLQIKDVSKIGNIVADDIVVMF